MSLDFDPDDIRHTLLALQSLPEAVARIDERQKMVADDVTEVKEHVKLTNGRVTALELWKNRTLGALALIVILAPVWIPRLFT